jgi:hypothetical protein
MPEASPTNSDSQENAFFILILILLLLLFFPSLLFTNAPSLSILATSSVVY